MTKDTITIENLKEQNKSVIEVVNLLKSIRDFGYIFPDEEEELLDEYTKWHSGLDNVPKKYQEKCWWLAWELGHSCGYSEVENYLIDIVSIFE